MTAQISDRVKYRKKLHSVAGISGSGLFDPAQHGIMPVAMSTACWRGFHCTYAVDKGHLYLTQLTIGLRGFSLDGSAESQCADPTVFGRQLTRNKKYGHYELDGLRETIPFTGGLLLGDQFIQSLYVHMGFHPAYKFRIVHELVFDAGRLLEEHDRTAQMAEFRQMLSEESLKPDAEATRTEIKQWVERCFSQDYTGFRTSTGSAAKQAVKRSLPETHEFHCPECQKGLERSKRNECSNCGWLKYPTSSREGWGTLGPCPKCGFAYRWEGNKCSHCGHGI